MKVLAVNQSYQRNNDVNFGLYWVYPKNNLWIKRAYPQAIKLTDESLFDSHIPEIGNRIINFVNAIQCSNIDGHSLNYTLIPNELPDLFLKPEDKELLLDAVGKAEIEIATAPEENLMADILNNKWGDPKSACGRLRKIVEDFVIKAIPFGE